MFDIGNEMESIKHRDKLAALDREFPGEGCGNPECENLCAEALQIAKAMRLDPKIMIEDSIKQGIAPQTHCVPASAEFTPPFLTAPCRFGFVCPNDHLALSESSKDSSFYVFHAKPGSCEKCQACDGITIPADKMQDESYMRSLGFWKQKDGVFRPHPNCNCKWEKTNTYGIIPDQAETENKSYDRYHSELRQGKGHDLHLRVKGSPGIIGNLEIGGIEVNDIDDLLNKLESKYNAHSVDRLIISNHGGLEGAFPMGDGDMLNRMSPEQIERLKKMLHPDSIIDIRMCHTSGGKEGHEAAQKLANQLGCRILGYEGSVSYYGTRASWDKIDKDRPRPYWEHILPDPKPKMFYPKLKK